MAKGTKVSEFDKGEITALKRVGKSQKFWRGLDTIKLLSAITWNVQINLEQENRLAGQKNYHPNSREDCSQSKKENFINIKNIEISSGCSLQYLNN